MLFHFDRRKKSEKEKKPPRFLVLRRKWLTLGAAVLAAAAIFAAVNYPAAVSASAATRQLPIYCVQRDQKVCSISFDAAWGADNTQKILDVLKEYGVTCTFFVVGNWADQYPEQAKAIVDSGNELMNHSNAHDHYNSLTADQIIADVNTCNDKIEALTGVRPTLIRCPFGEYDDHVISTIRSIGMEPIQWDVEALAAVGTARGASDMRAPYSSSCSGRCPFRRAQQKAHHVERVARAVEIECREPYDRRQGSKPQRGGRGASCSSARAWEESGWGYKRCEWG